jgi:hypothetical protein
MLVMLIFAPTFASSIASNPDLHVKCLLHVAKGNAAHSQSELQLTYEEREKEEDTSGEQKSKHSVATIIASSVASFHYTLFSFTHSRLIPLHAHIYLVRKALRI